MKRSMKFLCALFCAVLLLSNLSVFAGVENGPAVIVLDSKEGMPGETVHLQLHLTKNPGITGLRFLISYDADRLILESAEYTGLGGKLIDVNLNKNPFILIWNVALYEFTETGVLADITFRIKDDAKAGTCPLKITYGNKDCIDFDLNNLDMDITNGAVKVLYNGSNCDHSWGEFVTTKKPEVGVDGEKTRTCGICSTPDTQPIPALKEPEATEPEDTTTPEVPEVTEPEDTTTPEAPEVTEPEDTTTPEVPEVTDPEDTTTPEAPEVTEPEDTTTPEVPEEGTTNIPGSISPPTGDEAVVLGIVSAIAAALVILLIILKLIREGKFKHK